VSSNSAGLSTCEARPRQRIKKQIVLVKNVKKKVQNYSNIFLAFKDAKSSITSEFSVDFATWSQLTESIDCTISLATLSSVDNSVSDWASRNCVRLTPQLQERSAEFTGRWKIREDCSSVSWREEQQVANLPVNPRLQLNSTP